MRKTREEIMAAIVDIIQEQLEGGAGEIVGSDYLTGDLCLDSLEVVELVIRLEEMYDFSIDDGEIDPFYDMTVDELISVVEKFSS